MKFSSIFTSLFLVGGSVAQTPEGFTPSVSDHLDVIFGTKVVSPPGMAMTKAETARQPTIGTAEQLNGTYVWLLIDLDASTNFLNPAAGQPSTYLHTVIRDFKSSGQTTADGVYTLTSTARGPVAWFAPQPAAENPPHPHRYTNLLFEQPENWAIPQSANQQLQNQKLGFNVASFIEAAGLDTPIAANYFNVTG